MIYEKNIAPVASISDRLGAEEEELRFAVGFVWKQRFPPHPPSRFYAVTIPVNLWRDGTFPASGEGKDFSFLLIT